MTRTVRLLGDAAKAVDSRSARSRQRKVGASEIGVCRRRAGYSHHGVRYTDPENASGLKAVAGTWYHHGALDTMRREWGSLIETTVEDEILRGHVDAIELPDEWRAAAGLPPIPDAPDVVEVDDLKTKDDARAIDYVRIRGPKRSELYQVHLYADLLRRGKVGPWGTGRWKKHEKSLSAAVEALGIGGPAGVPGLPVERIRLRYMARTGHEGAEYVHEQDFDPDIAEEAWGWVEQVANSDSPDDLPRDQDGPGLSVVCDNCPFLTACWGPPIDGVKPQAQEVITDGDLAAAMRQYDEGRALEAEGKRLKDVARARLDATDPAIYTDGKDVAYKLGWSGGRLVPASEEPDVDAMLALFAEAGLKVPVREVPERRTAKSIQVVPWTPPDPTCSKPVGEPIPHDVDGERWVQDRPRGGWSSYVLVETPTHGRPRGTEFIAGEKLDEATAGQFSKRFLAYVDPRPPCVLKKAHSGDCWPESAIQHLELDEDEDVSA